MEEWKAPSHQQKYAGRCIKNFGYDQSAGIQYRFNQLGFRGPDPTSIDSVIVFGNSISFGIGVEEIQTYTNKVAEVMGMPWINLSFGCWMHENHDHLQNIKIAAERNCDDLIIVQINNLDRRRINFEFTAKNNDKLWCIKHFCNWFDQVYELLRYKRKVWLYWDDQQYDLPSAVTTHFTIYNKLHLDQSLCNNPGTFGAKSHSAISKVILASQKYCKAVPR